MTARVLGGGACLALLLGLPLGAQDSDALVPSRVRFEFKRRPSLLFGEWLRVDFRAKFQTDFRSFSPERGPDLGLFELHRARVSIEGTFLKRFEYEVEREVRETNHPWRDVRVNYRHSRRFELQAGKFKEPFSLEQLTGPTRLEFVYRSLLGKYLAPARDLGVMAHGRFFRRGLNYQFGIFNRDGENARASQEAYTGGRTLAGRLTGTPLRRLPLPTSLKALELGGAFTTSNVPEGLKGLRGRTVAEETFFPHIYVQGRRTRLGTEMNWVSGPFSVKGEFVDVRDQRHGQGLSGEDLPDLVSRAWYLSGAWVLTGEQKAGGVEPRKNFVPGRGLGALEVAGRYEQLRFGSAAHPGRPSRSPRATNILGNSDRVWTFGINWYWNRFVKVQANAIREKIEDPQRSPISGRDRFWMGVCRLQFVL